MQGTVSCTAGMCNAFRILTTLTLHLNDVHSSIKVYFLPPKRPFHYKEQNRQCAYNVIFRRVRVTIVAMEKQSVLHILSVCL